MVKSRTSKQLRRRQAFKTPNKIEMIVCEGSSTEPTYFNALRCKLRLSAVQIEVLSPEDSEPIKVLDYAIAKKEEMREQGIRYEKVWCVVDVEIPPHQTLNQAWEKAGKTDKLELILSNPCIEYWFLLHFEKHTAPFNDNGAAMKALKTVYPSYKKTRIGSDILRHTDTAIRHAKEVLRENNCGEYLRDWNPSTHVHRVVKHLQDIQ